MIFPTRECSACQWGNPQFLAAFSIAIGDGLVMSKEAQNYAEADLYKTLNEGLKALGLFGLNIA